MIHGVIPPVPRMIRLPYPFLAAALAALIVSAPARAQPREAPGCDLLNADVIVHGIKLGDTASAMRVLGDDVRTVIADPMSDVPWYLFASRDNKQLLALRHHAKDFAQSYREIEVKYGRHDRKPHKLNVWEFATGKGIKLGATRRFVVGRLGPCFTSASQGGNETLRYQLADKNAAFLRLNKLEAYYAEYEFKRGRLIRYRFGHEPI
jgi:hypothetical protein